MLTHRVQEFVRKQRGGRGVRDKEQRDPPNERSGVAMTRPSWSAVRVLELAGYVGILVVVISRIPVVCSSMWLNACGATQPCRRCVTEGVEASYLPPCNCCTARAATIICQPRLMPSTCVAMRCKYKYRQRRSGPNAQNLHYPPEHNSSSSQ